MEDLANFWLNADSTLRQSITAASSEVDRQLSREPHVQGESRPQGRRITFVPPLAVVYRIEADGQTVSVLQVRLFRRRAH